MAADGRLCLQERTYTPMTLLVTGGAGFIGGNFVLDWIAGGKEPLVNLDKLTYAGNLETLASVREHPHHHFVQGDIGDRELVSKLMAEHKPRAVLNFAAESHVDNSIKDCAPFIHTNILGTVSLLDLALKHEVEKFIHISTFQILSSKF